MLCPNAKGGLYDGVTEAIKFGRKVEIKPGLRE